MENEYKNTDITKDVLKQNKGLDYKTQEREEIIEEGMEYIFPEKSSAWRDAVDKSINNIYYGQDIKEALCIMQQLHNGKSYEDIKDYISTQNYDKHLSDLILNVVLHFTSSGPELIKYLYPDLPKDTLDKINEIEHKNLEFASRQPRPFLENVMFVEYDVPEPITWNRMQNVNIEKSECGYKVSGYILPLQWDNFETSIQQQAVQNGFTDPIKITKKLPEMYIMLIGDMEQKLKDSAIHMSTSEYKMIQAAIRWVKQEFIEKFPMHQQAQEYTKSFKLNQDQPSGKD